MYEVIRTVDPAVFQALELEVQRQRHHLELIASENYASRAVMQSMPTCSPTAAPRPTWPSTSRL